MAARRRRRSVGVALVAVLALVTACGGGATDGGPVHISVTVAQANDINGLWWTIGQEKGFFKEHGIIVDEVMPAEGGGDTLQNLLAGDLPFGQVATAALVNAHQEGAPISVIAGGTQSPYEIGWAVRKDSDIKTVNDLDGKTWGFTNAGSVTEAMSYLVPAHAGLDMDATKRVATGGVGSGIALLESGDVDVTFVPPLVAAEQKDTLRIITHSDEHVPDYQLTMITAAREYVEENPEVARGLIAALQESVDWIKANPAEAGDIYARAVDADSKVGRETVKRYIEIDLWGLPFNPKTLDLAAEGLRYTDGIKKVDWSSLLTDEYLPENGKGQIP